MAENRTTPAVGMDARSAIQVSVRVPSEMVEALGRIAQREDRTVSAELRRIIRQHIERSAG